MNQTQLISRMKRVIPPWFGPGPTPNLDSLLAGFAQVFLWHYDLILYAKKQTRLGTTTGLFLDLASRDFFGRRIRRRSGELDDQLRARIKAEIFRTRVTRPAISKVLTDLTGRAPSIFEPANTGDTGGWDTGGMSWAGINPATGGGAGYNGFCGWDTNSWEYDASPYYSGQTSGGVGAWGDTNLPCQMFITAYRPGLQGIPNVSGYDYPGGGYDQGSLEYVDQSMIVGTVTDQDIYDAINYTRAAGIVAWTNLQ